jgi:O-antigen/teichoic acid export membrane protein
VSNARPAVATARAALTVGGSLIAGAAFAAVVRVALPRTLGPAGYGSYRLAESAAEALLLFLTLGLDTTLRRDVAQSPSQASARVADVVKLRATGGVLLAALAVLALWWGGASSSILALFSVFAAAQVLAAIANAHASGLHAVGDAGWPSAASVALRALWSVLALVILRLTSAPVFVAAALVLAEAARVLVLKHRGSKRHEKAETSPSLRAAGLAALASLPIFVNYLAHSLYARLGTWVLGLRAPAVEIGWYATASNVAGLALLGMPLVTWVLLPAAARAGTQDASTRDALVVGALRAVLIVGLPGIAALMWLAEPLVSMLFGAEYAPAAAVLRVLAPTIALAYLATVAAVAMLERGAERRVATVSILGLGVSLIVTLLLVRGGAAGSYALQAARAALVTETLIAATMLSLAWRRDWTAPLVRTAAGVGLSLAAAGVVLMTPLVTAHLPLLQLLFALPALVLTLLLTRALNRDDLAFARAVLSRKSSRAHAS